MRFGGFLFCGPSTLTPWSPSDRHQHKGGQARVDAQLLARTVLRAPLTPANLTDRRGNAACTQEETHTGAEPRALKRECRCHARRPPPPFPLSCGCSLRRGDGGVSIAGTGFAGPPGPRSHTPSGSWGCSSNPAQRP